MTLRLHWSPDSANLVVRIALELLDLPFEGIRVDRAAEAHKASDYLAKNPQGLIPVLEDGEITLFETGAILWHLAERAGRLGPDGPAWTDRAVRARALKWVFFVSNTLHADLRVAFYTDRYVPAEHIGMLRDGIRRRVRGHCDLVEGQVADGGLAGPWTTMADIYLAVCLRWAQIYPRATPLLVDLRDWPRLRDLARRIEDLPGARAAFSAESIPAGRALSESRPVTLPVDEVTGQLNPD